MTNGAGVSADGAFVSTQRFRYAHNDQDPVTSTYAAIRAIVGDRFKSYGWIKRRQFCWAHLNRDFQAMVDRGGESAEVGRLLLGHSERLFDWCVRRFRCAAPNCTRAIFCERLPDLVAAQSRASVHEVDAMASVTLKAGLS